MAKRHFLWPIFPVIEFFIVSKEKLNIAMWRIMANFAPKIIANF